MDTKKLIKKEIIITLISVLIISGFFMFITYAFYSDVDETDLNVINYGDLSLTFCADSTCGSSISNIGRIIGKDLEGNPTLMYPQYEVDALNNVPYIFKVSNTGDYPLKVSIKLTKEIDPSLNENYSNYTEIDNNYINTAFGELGDAPNVRLFSSLINNNLLTITINPGATKVFNLWTWVNINAPNTVQGSYFIANISLTGEYESQSSLIAKMIADNNPKSDENINFAQTSEQSNTNGLYYTDDETVSTYGEDGQKIYYYRGDVDNNWLSFGGYLWRIVRTTSEGGVKLVYSGDGLTDSSAFINNTVQFNSTRTNKYTVGYTFNTSGYTEVSQSNSNIKSIVDTWYTGSGSNNMSTNYGSYLSTTAIYCNDRSIESVSGTNLTYPAHDRLANLKRPSFACSETNKSRYTVETNTGNGLLTNPVALLSADEISYAGLIHYVDTTSLTTTPYIMDNATANNWWNMSPYSFTDNNTYTFRVAPTGFLGSNFVDGDGGVRPSVSLKKCIITTGGNGNKSTPYTISDQKCQE